MANTENLKNVADVFQMFHDGGIIAYEGDNTLLRLTIQCDYLAELIKPEFQFFYIDLFEITQFDLDAWNPIGEPPLILHGFAQSLQAELEIGYSDVLNDHVRVSCHQSDDNYNYVGGNLLVNCSAIKVYNQELNELTVDELETICDSYWSRARD